MNSLLERTRPDRTSEPAPRRLVVRTIYVLALLSLVLPSPFSPWGAVPFSRGVPLVLQAPMLAFVAIVVWRIVGVIRDAGRLDAPAAGGVADTVRRVALWIVAVGLAVTVLRFFVGPLTQTIFGEQRAASGAVYLAVGLWLAMLAWVVPLGVLLFEATRLAALEKWYRERRDE